MTSWIGGIGLPEVIAGIMVLALNAYVLTGGADYGGGVWDLLASGDRRREQRELVADSIAPIWEANHVWLIVVVVMLFTAFPAAFGTLPQTDSDPPIWISCASGCCTADSGGHG